MRLLNLTAIFFIASFSNAIADTDYDDKVTKLNFNETARIEVVDDRYKAVLKYSSEESHDKSLIQSQVNKKMKLALKIAKDQEDLKVNTLNYRVSKVWNKNVKNLWVASQEVMLDSDNKDGLLEVVNRLQINGFAMSSLSSYLSLEKRDSYKNNLISEALKRVKKSATLVAKEMDRDEVRFLDITINPHFPRNTPIMFHRAAFESSRASFDRPVVAAADRFISVDVAAVVLLKD